MLIGVHQNKLIKQNYAEKWAEFLIKYNVPFEFVDILHSDLNDLIKYDGIFFRWALSYPTSLAAPILLDIIEEDIGIPVYPDRAMRWTWDSKIKQFYQLSSLNIPMPLTYIFWDEAEALTWAKSEKFPKVFKLSRGASSHNVTLIQNQEEAFHIIRAMFSKGIGNMDILSEVKRGKRLKPFLRKWKNYLLTPQRFAEMQRKEITEKSYVYFQELVEDNKFDTRITVIGERAFGFRRFNRDNDFRASGSGKIDFDPNVIDPEIVRYAFELNRKLKVHCMAYDFLRDREGRILLIEMCWTFADWAVQTCPGHWGPSLKWFEGRMWPEEAQVIDFVKLLKNHS